MTAPRPEPPGIPPIQPPSQPPDVPPSLPPKLPPKLPPTVPPAAPLTELVAAIGRSLSIAQTEIDRSSLLLQRSIDADPALASYGVQATWYQIPSSEVEIKAALTIGPPSADRTTAPSLHVSPLNPQFIQQFGFDPSAASTVRFKLVPVPPRTTDALQTPTQLTEAAVLQAAAPELEKGAAAAKMPLAGTRVVATFNPGTRLWYVVQFREEKGQVSTVAVLEVDDATGRVTRR